MNRVLYIGTDCCEAFVERLRRENDWDITIAATGREGVKFSHESFDLMLVSVRIPDMSSWRFLQKVKQASKTPAVLLGNIPVSEDRVEALRSEGFSDYLLDHRGEVLFGKVKELVM